jgi:hypothetical protein
VSFGHQVDAGNHSIGLGATTADQQHPYGGIDLAGHTLGIAPGIPDHFGPGAVAGLHRIAGGVMEECGVIAQERLATDHLHRQIADRQADLGHLARSHIQRHRRHRQGQDGFASTKGLAPEYQTRRQATCNQGFRLWCSFSHAVVWCPPVWEDSLPPHRWAGQPMRLL